MRLKFLYIIFLIFFCSFSWAQGGFHIEEGKEKFSMDFELVNDLVIIPVELNGLELSFLLDTGVNSTILFSLDQADSLDLRNAEVIYLRGLGEGEPFQAIKSSGNIMKIGNAINKELPLYVVHNNPINLSNRMGIPIHGIIGYDFFKDFVLNFNYPRKKLKVTNVEAYRYKKCGNCEDLMLTFDRNKPYINLTAHLNGQENVPINLLIDSGSGDALWLFTNDNDGISVPVEFFEDYLGFGMGGSVYGYRSRINQLSIGKRKLKNITTSFPNPVYFRDIETFEKRNGSLGSQVLKRFHSTFDYTNKVLRLKPNKWIKKPFEYDMSGVVIAHEGFTVVKGVNHGGLGRDNNQNAAQGETVFRSTYKVEFSLEPQYVVVEIRPGSPAAIAGLKKGDILKRINGRAAYKYSLAKITDIFSSYDGKRMKLRVEREGREKKVSFYLEKIL